MTRTIAFVIFLSIGFALVAGVHFYFYLRLIRDTQLQGTARTAAIATLTGLGLMIPTMLVLGRVFPVVGRVLQWPAYVWLGTMFLLLVAVAATDVTRLILAIASRISHAPAPDPARRAFHARVLAGAAGLLTGAAAISAVLSARGAPRIRRLHASLRRLPASLDGFRIVQLSDLHVGDTLGRRFVEDVVERTNALAPDLIAITGDLVDGHVEQLRESLAPLVGLRARHGVYFVTGNHEYFSGVHAWIAELQRMGMHVLGNQRAVIEQDGHSFDLAGTHDRFGRRFNHLGEDLPAALEGRDPSRELILLAHQPVTVKEAAQHGVGLQLSGHTHGGQIWPFTYLVYLQQPYVVGNHRVGDTLLCISNGTGYWGPPLRFRAPPEIVEITLHRGDPSVTTAPA